MDTEQLVHLGPEELARLDALADRLVAGDELADKEALVLVQKPRAADIALFGRMLADNPLYNVEAAAQVAHAFTTHRVSVEDDFYTAVDDLKSANREADRGAGFIGVQEYGAGIFYLYVCLDADQLVRNLAGDKALAGTTAEALRRGDHHRQPQGQAEQLCLARLCQLCAGEMGTRTPRSLAAAFVKPGRRRRRERFRRRIEEAAREAARQLRYGLRPVLDQRRRSSMSPPAPAPRRPEGARTGGRRCRQALNASGD